MLGLHASAEGNTDAIPGWGAKTPTSHVARQKEKKLFKVNSSSTGNKGTNIKCQSVVDRLLCISNNSSHFMVEETGLGEKMAES